MKELNFVFALLLLSVVGGTPLNRNEKCERIDNELKLFRGILDNSNNLNNTIDNVLQYFNVSELYKTPLLEKIDGLCQGKQKN